jgi:phosphoglycolate phosphatase-like HAD superfamily hydrolase
LQRTSGVVQSVLTGNVRPNAFAKLSAFELEPYIDFDVGGYGSDDSVRSNLVAVARERALAKYGIAFDHNTTVLIGDTTRDVRAGLDGGARVIAVASGIDSVEDLRDAGADAALPDLCDTDSLVAIIKSFGLPSPETTPS